MEIQLTGSQEAFISRNVESGRFASPDDAVREAVDLLARHESELQRLRGFVQEGIADLDSAEYEEFADENLHELFNGVISRGRVRLAVEPRS
jgi:putative addiction module CopG family antidote